MPLARIFTHHPERTTALSEQLQQQGYRVEVLSPDQTNLAPADLEIEFEICERADVLERAASLADELQADVAVAPGVLQAEAKPAVAEPVLAEAAGPTTTEQERDREREFQAAFQPVDTEIEAAARADLPVDEQGPQLVEVPVMEQAPLHPSKLKPSLPGTPDPLPPVQFIDEPPVIRPELVHAANETPEAARAADPVPYLAQLTPFGTPQEHTQIENTQRFEDRKPMLPETAARKAAEPGFGARAADLVGKSLAAMKVGIAETAQSFREHLQEYKKRAQVRSAESRAARVARMLDLEQRKAEAQQRAAELEVAREAAAARLVELLRQRDPGLHEERQQEESLRAEVLREEGVHQSNKPAAAEASPWRKPLEALRHLSIASLLRKPRQPMSPQLRAVLTGAAAVTILFVIGIIVGTLQPRTPLANTSNPATSSSGATVQSGGATRQTGGVTLKAGTPAQAAPAKAQPAPASAATANQGSTSEKPSPRVAQTRRQVAQQSEDEIGDDVVIRHFSRPVPTQKPKQSGQQAGLKHFSDMEN